MNAATETTSSAPDFAAAPWGTVYVVEVDDKTTGPAIWNITMFSGRAFWDGSRWQTGLQEGRTMWLVGPPDDDGTYARFVLVVGDFAFATTSAVEALTEATERARKTGGVLDLHPAVLAAALEE